MTGNTPGIQRKPIPSLKPSTTGASSVSSSAKSAATSGLNGAKKTQVFHRNLGQNGSVFGGGWQPAARGFNPHDPVSANVNRYAALRQQANIYNTGGMYNFGQVTGHNHSGTDKMAEVMAWTQLGMQALNMAGEMTTDIIELVQANKAAAPGATVAKAAIPTANTVSSENASLVSDMSGAKDAASLNSAIGKAEAKLNEINGSLDDLKTSAETAQTQLSDLEGKKSAKLKEFNTADGELKEAKKTLSGKKQQLENSKIAFKSACGATAKAREDYALAVGNRQAAETNLATIEAQYKAASANPEQQAALAPALAEAQTRLAQAKQEETRTLNARDTAIGEEGKANETMKTAEDRLAAQQRQVTEMEDKVAALEKQKTEINKELEALQKDINAANGDIKKYETAKKDAEALEAQITQQEARLKTLQQEEKTKYEALKTENQELTQSIDGKVDTKKESKATQKISENNEEMRQMMEDAKKGILKGPAENIAGTEFRTGKAPDGSTIYMVGEDVVTLDEYNTAKTAAQAKLNDYNTIANYNDNGTAPAGFTNYDSGSSGDIKYASAKKGEETLYTVNGKPVDKATYEATKSAPSKAQRARVTLGSPTIINNTKFEVTKDGKFKIGGCEVAEEAFSTQIRDARTAEEKAQKEATMKKDLVAAQLNKNGQTVNEKTVNIIVNTEQGTIEYKIDDKTYDSKAAFEDAFKKLYQT